MPEETNSKMEPELETFGEEKYPLRTAAPDEDDNTMYSLTENEEPQSLEYMEDPYFIQLESGATPSLDPPEEEDGGGEEECWAALNSLDMERDLPLDIDTNEDSMLCIETEFIMDNRKRRLRIFKKKMRDVRVHFQDLSKPYLVKISSQNNYKKFLGLGNGGVDNVFIY